VGGSFEAGLWIAPIVAIAYWIDGFALLAESPIYTGKKTHWAPIVTSLGILLNIALNLYAIPRWGIIAAAVTTVVSYVAILAMFLLICQRMLPVAIPWAKLLLQAMIIAGSFYASLNVDSILTRSICFVIASVLLVVSSDISIYILHIIKIFRRKN
jgi:O-antigen/teichoic acid export membrane protein